MGRRPICESKRVPNPRPSLYFLGFFEDNDERGLRFAEHERVASFGAQCGCLGAYDRPCFLRWTPRAGMSMMVESPAKFVGLGVIMGRAHKASEGGRLCTGTANEARNKFFPSRWMPRWTRGGRGFDSPFREAARTGRTARSRISTFLSHISPALSL